MEAFFENRQLLEKVNGTICLRVSKWHAFVPRCIITSLQLCGIG